MFTPTPEVVKDRNCACAPTRRREERFDGPHAWIDGWEPARATRPKARSVGYDLRMAPAVASSVISPLRSRPFSAALMAETLARPTAAPMVRASAGTCGGMLVRRRLVPPLM